MNFFQKLIGTRKSKIENREFLFPYSYFLTALSLMFSFFAFSFFFTHTADAFSGSARLYLTESAAGAMTPGETRNITIRLDTTGLELGAGESVQLVSSYLTFPNNLIEIQGDISFSGSAFSAPYRSTYDNDTGIIDIVRGSDGNTNLNENDLVAQFTIKVNEEASNSVAQIQFVNENAEVLLNDIDNSNVVGQWDGLDITIGYGGTAQAGEVTYEENEGGQTANPIRDATIRLVPEKTALDVEETVPVQIRMNTGSATNSVSSAELNFTFPTSLHITENAVDLQGGVFHNATVNSIVYAQGKINLQLLANSSLEGNDLYIGKFYVKRLAPGNSTINIMGDSILQADDPDNTNVLNLSGSAGVTFTAPGPSVTASISPTSILEEQSATITFQSTQTGDFHVRPHDCTSLDSYASGQVAAINTDQEVDIHGADVGAGDNHRMVVCVTNSVGAVGQSNDLFLTVGKVEEPKNPPKVKICSVTPRVIEMGESSSMIFVSDQQGEMQLRKGNCSGAIVPFYLTGSRVTRMNISQVSEQCSENTNTIVLTQADLGNPASYTLSVCVTNEDGMGSAAGTLQINGVDNNDDKDDEDEDTSTGGSSGSGGGGGWRRDSNAGSHGASRGPCEKPENFRVEALPNGKFLFQWNQVADPNVEKFILSWGTESRNLNQSIQIPKIKQLVFPGKDMVSGNRYYFALSTVGACDERISNEVSAVKKGNEENPIDEPEEPKKEYPTAPKTSDTGPTTALVIFLLGIGLLAGARWVRKRQ